MKRHFDNHGKEERGLDALVYLCGEKKLGGTVRVGKLATWEGLEGTDRGPGAVA